MTESDAELLTELVAAFSTVIAETMRAICRNSGGQVSRHSIAIHIHKHADKLPQGLDIARRILGNISAQLGDQPFTPLMIPSAGK